MLPGEYSINVPVGNYKVAASKTGYIPEAVEDVEVLENQATVLNFELIGGDNMEYIEPIVVVDGSMITINVPIEEPTVSIKFLDVDVPMDNKNVALLAEDNTTLQTKITNAEGIATFENVLHGNYNVKIIY